MITEYTMWHSADDQSKLQHYNQQLTIHWSVTVHFISKIRFLRDSQTIGQVKKIQHLDITKLQRNKCNKPNQVFNCLFLDFDIYNTATVTMQSQSHTDTVIRLHRMHEMQTIVTVCHSVQPLPNYFGLLLILWVHSLLPVTTTWVTWWPPGLLILIYRVLPILHHWYFLSINSVLGLIYR